MAITVQQILDLAREIGLKTRKGKANFIMVPVDDFPRLRECVERAEKRRRCDELEEKLNKTSKVR
jgi:hypothetical protein